MQVFLLILSGISFIVAGWQWRNRRKRATREAVMLDTQRASVSMLKELQTEMRDGVGAGHLYYQADLSGKVVCEQPLVSDLAEQSCVYFAMEVSRTYEVLEWERDARGQSVQRRRRGSQALASEKQFTAFYLEDNTGRIRIEPEGAEFIAETALERNEPPQVYGAQIRVGNYVMTAAANPGGAERTTGYAFREKIIPVGATLYALGEVTDAGGELCLRQPSEKGTFLLSTRSETDLRKELTRKMRSNKIIATVAVTIGSLAVLIYALRAAGLLG